MYLYRTAGALPNSRTSRVHLDEDVYRKLHPRNTDVSRVNAGRTRYIKTYKTMSSGWNFFQVVTTSPRSWKYEVIAYDNVQVDRVML